MMNLVILGPAGSGKSTFVKNFSEFLKSEGYSVGLVNLDPASPPVYKADKDLRDYVKTEEVMREFSLGINGGLIKSMEIALSFIDELVESKNDFNLYDTPGQMELFLYTSFGEEIIRKISSSDRTVCLFLVDSEVASTPENFFSIILQGAVVSVRFSTPTLTLLNKCDKVAIDIDELLEKAEEASGAMGEITEALKPFVDYTSLRFRPLRISAKDCVGFEEVLTMLNEVFCTCGDLS